MYGCRACESALPLALPALPMASLPTKTQKNICTSAADQIAICADIAITDPPYGDAVKYEEILDFFIAWLRKNPPAEFADWVWDSRRSLAIKGEDEDFRRGMVAAYKRMTECMPDNGIQVIMFTHQSGSIWADMANIVWASGLQVTAAWYVVTETDSASREGSYVKGTVLLVLPQARRHAQDHPRRPCVGDPGGGRGADHAPSPASTRKPRVSTATRTSSRTPTSRWRATPRRCACSRATPPSTAAT